MVVSTKMQRFPVLLFSECRKDGFIVILLYAIINIFGIMLAFFIYKFFNNEKIQLNTKNEKNNAVTNEKVDADTSKVFTKSQAKLRYQPSMMSNIIIEVGAGKELTKNFELGNWIQVTDGTVTGWIIKSKTSK